MQEFLSLPGVYCLPILKKSYPDKKQEWHHSHTQETVKELTELSEKFETN